MGRGWIGAITIGLVLAGCGDGRRVPRGAGGGTVNRSDGGGTRADTGAPIAIDGGFDDAGRPIDGGFADSGVTPPGGDLGPEAFCEESKRVWCQANQRCCMRETGRFASFESCLTELTAFCLSGPSLSDGRAQWDPAAAGRLISAAERAGNACERVADGEAPIRGMVGLGGACGGENDLASFFSCVPGAYCRFTEETPSGTCTAYAQASELCLERQCARELVCTSERRICEPAPALGQRCEEERCAEGWCVGGTCTDRAPADDYCQGE